MDKALAELSTSELTELIERAIDRRLSVWLTQMLDALPESQLEEDATMRPEFAGPLECAIGQARSGQGVDLAEYRKRLGR